METLKEKLDFIRESIDKDLTSCVIDDVVEQGKKLAQLIGLSAECKAIARRRLEISRGAALMNYQNLKSATVIMKLVDADCADEIHDFEYADRLNAGITHQLDYYRSVISLYKTELETSLKS